MIIGEILKPIVAEIVERKNEMDLAKEIIELHKYFNGSGMSVVKFEEKFDRLKAKAEKLIAERESEVKAGYEPDLRPKYLTDGGNEGLPPMPETLF